MNIFDIFAQGQITCLYVIVTFKFHVKKIVIVSKNYFGIKYS